MRLLIGMLMSGLVAAQAPAGPLVFGPQAAWFRPADAEGIARAVAPYGGRPWCSNAARGRGRVRLKVASDAVTRFRPIPISRLNVESLPSRVLPDDRRGRVMERNRYLTPILALGLVVICVHPSHLAAQSDRDPLRSAMAKRIDEGKQGTGAVVGLLTPQGRSFATYGRISLGGPEVTPDTIFEIGSITKVFTAFLLADMVERGEVMLNDPVRKFLPASVTVPSRRGKEITLVDLATQTSGLPRDSVKVDLDSPTSAYADYTASQIYAFLAGFRLDRDPGSKYEYSNVGFGLLGHALALRAGISYEDLLRRRIFEPLDMSSTSITLTAEQRSRRATGYNGKLLGVEPWNGGVLAPTGSIMSTAADMLKFGAAMVDPNNPLKAAFARMTSVRRPSDGPRSDQVLGWGIFRLGPNELVGHSGGTLGFQTRLIVDLTRKRSVVAWINGQGESVTDLVGMALDRASLQ